MEYFCSQCGQPTTPRLEEVGVVSECCWREEAPLMVINRDNYWFWPIARPLNEDEERDLAEELYAETDAERTPAERARNNWLGRS